MNIEVPNPWHVILDNLVKGKGVARLQLSSPRFLASFEEERTG